MTIELKDCLAHYKDHGVVFVYPDIWQLQEQMDDEDVIIQVSASETCFWTLRILPGCPAPPQVVNSCVTAFEEEYDDLEVAETSCSLAEMPAFSRDLDFFCLELTNSVGLRSVRTNDFTLLVWWQGTQHELAEFRPIIEQMTLSVRTEQLMD